MEYSFYDFLKLLGSLALFLYGMKIMSEGLQKFAGDRLRKILTAMTTNRVTGMLTGVLITALVQSSSATTVMVVSFVNAGLLTLSQSIGHPGKHPAPLGIRSLPWCRSGPLRW